MSHPRLTNISSQSTAVPDPCRDDVPRTRYHRMSLDELFLSLAHTIAHKERARLAVCVEILRSGAAVPHIPDR